MPGGCVKIRGIQSCSSFSTIDAEAIQFVWQIKLTLQYYFYR